MASQDDYRRVNLGGAPKSEYGQVNPADTYPNAPSELIPTPGDPERQFSEDKASTPDAMASETDDSQSSFAELQTFLMNNLETPGSRVCHDQTKPYRPPHGAEGE
jgi:hypothetical protein